MTREREQDDAEAATVADGVLARKAGMGDARAFAELFDRHFQASFRYALHMLDGDEDLAAEASQDAWVKAWRYLPDFRGDSRVQTWILSIVSRSSLDLRRRRRPIPVDDSIIEARLGSTDEGDPVRRAIDRELWEELSLALTELPWRQKACWLLRELEGQSYDEIARILDTTPTVVRGQLHRARRAVAIRMEAWR